MYPSSYCTQNALELLWVVSHRHKKSAPCGGREGGIFGKSGRMIFGPRNAFWWVIAGALGLYILIGTNGPNRTF